MPTGFRYEDEAGRPHDAFFRIDKGMVAALVGMTIAIVTQTGSFLWWASSISTTVSQQERRLADMETWRGSTTTRNEELVRLSVQVQELAERVRSLDGRRLPITP
jgi:hypothetical protein